MQGTRSLVRCIPHDEGTSKNMYRIYEGFPVNVKINIRDVLASNGYLMRLRSKDEATFVGGNRIVARRKPKNSILPFDVAACHVSSIVGIYRNSCNFCS